MQLIEPLPPTPLNRFLAGAFGFATGIILQIGFVLVVNAILGAVPQVFSWQLLVWVLLLITPPILTYRYLVVAPGSLVLDFIRGMQAGALFWFVVILVRIFGR
jgi:hypothetical protein